MKHTLAIFQKEFKSYFTTPIAYIFITIFLFFVNLIFFYLPGVFVRNVADMREFFMILPWIFLLFVPLVTMRLWAEEKKLGTMELLMTLPVRESEVIVGKFMAAFLFLAIAIILTAPIAITLNLVGDPDMGPIYGGYLGALLLGGAYLAIGLFSSSLTENQIVAFIIGVFICFILLFTGSDILLFALPGWLVAIFKFIGLGSHFDSIGRGVVDSRDVIYYLSVIGFFLFLNLRSVESRKWK
ncbi:ABC transporter permease [bacterium]|nr:ABC transporter permease [candidate division CSSED10-310 bacterium]